MCFSANLAFVWLRQENWKGLHSLSTQWLWMFWCKKGHFLEWFDHICYLRMFSFKAKCIGPRRASVTMGRTAENHQTATFAKDTIYLKNFSKRYNISRKTWKYNISRKAWKERQEREKLNYYNLSLRQGRFIHLSSGQDWKCCCKWSLLKCDNN